MYAEERQQLITRTAHRDGRVSVSRLAAELEVASETIRRDLEILDRRGILRRVHGGAVPAESLRLVEVDVPERAATHVAEKERIARAALAHLPVGGGAVILDGGTTAAQLAALLPADPALTVITNSVPAAVALAARSVMPVYLLGGRLRGVTQATVGNEAQSLLGRTRVDVTFLGTNGVTAAHGLSTPDPDEAGTKRAMVAAARRVVALADSSKFGQEHLVSFARAEDVDVIITDTGVPDADRAALEALDVEVVVA
jgi:DeoR family fructose operon transcriptional repressor